MSRTRQAARNGRHALALHGSVERQARDVVKVARVTAPEHRARFDAPAVHVRKVGREIILSALPPQGADALIDALCDFDLGAPLRREQPAEQQRTPLRRER